VEAEDFEPYRGWTVSRFDIEGIESELASGLKRGLALATTSGILGSQRAPFFPEKLDEDLQRARLYLARRGYPYARLTPTVEPRTKSERLAIVLHVSLGSGVRTRSVFLDSLPADLHAADFDLPLEAGSLFIDTDVQKSVQALVETLRSRGYARAHVVPRVRWIDASQVEAHLVVRSGAVYFFGDVHVEGIGEDLVPLAHKTIGIQRGRRYSPKRLSDAREDLRALNLFQQTRLEIVDSAPDTVDVVASLVERRPTTLNASVRYWTDEQIQGTARWTHRNLFRNGRGASVGISASPYLQRADATVWWMGLPRPRTSTILTGRSERESEESYTTVSTGGILSLRYSRSFETSLRMGLDISNVSVTEKVSGDTILAQDGLLTALLVDAARRDTDDPITATRGTNVGVSFEWAPDQLGSDNSYVLGSLGLALYIPLLKRTQTAFRVTMGLGTPTGESLDLLPNKRFFSGGAVSHRGFQRRKLGPLDLNGAPIGGEAKLETSLELRFPLFWKFRGTLFTDIGQVWERPEEANLNSLEVAIGPGIWLQTLIGPIRLDWGYRLTDYEPSQPESVFHFSVGPAF
jgi:outer membrane protein assembly factor BamA